jgi:hypothetical protein
VDITDDKSLEPVFGRFVSPSNLLYNGMPNTGRLSH